MSVAVLTVGIGLAAGGPAAHAGSFCGWTGGWAPMTLVNGWVSEQNAYNTGDPSYCLEADGMVYLSGSIAASSGTPASETFATLPPAERPAHEIYLDVYTENGTYGILRIDTDGTMEAYGGSANGYTSLAGVSFPAAGFSQTGIMPLENGWQSAQNIYNTGDPSYSISNGIVHLSGSMYRPAGPPPTFSYDTIPGMLPPQALPQDPDDCFDALTYTYGGSMGGVGIDNSSGNLYGFENYKYTSLAGINYPGPGTAWQSMTPLNGVQENECAPSGPAYYLSGNVVYLDGTMQLPPGFDGEIAVLPPAARPTHSLYMIALKYVPSTDSNEYVTLRIDPDGSMWAFDPANNEGEAGTLVMLSGLSVHALS